MDRRRLTRWVAPVAFLLAVTIGALVVRAGFEQGTRHAKKPTTTLTTKKTRSRRHRQQHLRTYIVQTGDTFASIARKAGTTVAKLERLNPGVDATALQVGEKIRVQ